VEAGKRWDHGKEGGFEAREMKGEINASVS